MRAGTQHVSSYSCQTFKPGVVDCSNYRLQAPYFGKLENEPTQKGSDLEFDFTTTSKSSPHLTAFRQQPRISPGNMASPTRITPTLPYDQSHPPIQWLPTELVVEIMNLLPAANAVAFALTCKRFICALPDGLSESNRKLKKTDRVRFLGLLQRDYGPSYGFCSDICSRLHRLQQWTTSIKCHRARYPQRGNIHRAPTPGKPAWEVGDWWNVGRISYHDAHQVMLRDRLGERHGQPLSSLFTSSDWTKLELGSGRDREGAWPTKDVDYVNSVLVSYIKADTAARIVQDNLVLRYTQRIWVPVCFSDPGWMHTVWRLIDKLCLQPLQSGGFRTETFSHWMGKAAENLSNKGGATSLLVRLDYQARGYYHGDHGFEFVWQTLKDLGRCDPEHPFDYLPKFYRPKSREDAWGPWGPENPALHSECRHSSASVVLDDWRRRGVVTSEFSSMA